jgi:hypothetical protein
MIANNSILRIKTYCMLPLDSKVFRDRNDMRKMLRSTRQLLKLMSDGMLVTREYTFSLSSAFLEQLISNSYITGGT